VSKKNNIGYLGLGRGGNLIMALLGFFALTFALWSVVVDTNITYRENISEYQETFDVLQTQGNTLINLSGTFADKIIEDDEWQAKDYMIVGTGMINLILQLIFSILPIMMSTINIVREVLLNIGVPTYLILLLIGGIVIYVVLIIISMFRGKDY